jgi:hypothetical protein
MGFSCRRKGGLETFGRPASMKFPELSEKSYSHVRTRLRRDSEDGLGRRSTTRAAAFRLRAKPFRRGSNGLSVHGNGFSLTNEPFPGPGHQRPNCKRIKAKRAQAPSTKNLRNCVSAKGGWVLPLADRFGLASNRVNLIAQRRHVSPLSSAQLARKPK